jgi:hypothetical protein
MARRPAAIKDRARGPTRSMPPISCKQQEKNRRPGTTGACGFPVSSRMTTGNARDRRRVGRPGLPSITGRNRTKTGNGRNPGLHNGCFQGRLEPPSPRMRLCSSTIEAGPVNPGGNDECRCCVLASHDVKQPTLTARPLIAARTRLHVAARLISLRGASSSSEDCGLYHRFIM